MKKDLLVYYLLEIIGNRKSPNFELSSGISQDTHQKLFDWAQLVVNYNNGESFLIGLGKTLERYIAKNGLNDYVVQVAISLTRSYFPTHKGVIYPGVLLKAMSDFDSVPSPKVSWLDVMIALRMLFSDMFVKEA